MTNMFHANNTAQSLDMNEGNSEGQVASHPLRDAQGRLLPGQASINPNGRKPNSHRVRTLARAYIREAVEVLAEAMRNAPNAEVRIKAATALLDRGWGRPAQQLSADINDTKVVTINLGWLKERGIDNVGVIQHDNHERLDTPLLEQQS